MHRRKILTSVILAGLMLSAACGSSTPGASPAPKPKEGPTITVGSANFTESIVLGEIYAQGLASQGYQVAKKLNLGSRELYFPALEKGTVDLMPEYTGSLLSFVTSKQSTSTSDSQATYDKLKTELAKDKITALAMSSAQDKDGIVTNSQSAAQYKLKKVSDLKAVEKKLVMGGPPECPQRPACGKGLKDVYGIELKEFRPLDTGGPQTILLLKSNQIQVANLFTTDGRIAQNGFVLLEDDKGISGSDNVLPVVRDELIKAYGDELVTYLNSITAKLTTAGLTELNKKVDIDKLDAKKVASTWLRDAGFA